MTSPSEKFDSVAFVISYEQGELTEQLVIEGFQHLITSGLVWQLQGSYGRTAAALIEAGDCYDPRDPRNEPTPAEDDFDYAGDELFFSEKENRNQQED